MPSKLQQAVQDLSQAHADFDSGKLSPVGHRDARESALARALCALAAEENFSLQEPLYIDANGDYRLVVQQVSGEPVKGFGPRWAHALTRHQCRTGLNPGAVMLPESSWCYLNHFAAERLVQEQSRV